MMKRERSEHDVEARRTRRATRWLPAALGAVLLATVVVAALAAPADTPPATGRLDPAYKLRLAEALRFKEALGDSVWPGWGRAAIPMVIWDGDDAFLVGPPSAPAGWATVDGDDIDGRPYYRRPAQGPRGSVVHLQGGLAAGVQRAGQRVGSGLQVLVNHLAPLVAKIVFAQRAGVPAEAEIMAVLHQSFHAFEVQSAPLHYQAAADATELASRYRTAVRGMAPAWQEEVSLLARAVRAGTTEEAAGLARQFLARRQARRRQARLAPALVDYERQMEWVDGLAAYTEVNMWRHAYIASDYQPLPALGADPGFHGYQTFDGYWTDEMAELEQQGENPAPGSLAYTGMAQAVLLDFLGVDWRGRVLSGKSLALEDLLAEAATTHRPILGTSLRTFALSPQFVV